MHWGSLVELGFDFLGMVADGAFRLSFAVLFRGALSLKGFHMATI